MELFYELPKLLAEIAYNLFSDRKKHRREQKQRFADLIERIAVCIYQIGTAIEEGKKSPAQCAELAGYICEIRDLATEFTDPGTAEKITQWLYHVEAVPKFAVRNIDAEIRNMASLPWSRSSRLAQGLRVQEISGSIRAVANLLRI